jgi:hypothetical protein
LEALQSLESCGCTAIGGPATTLPTTPGLVVEGIGPVVVPVSDHMACELKNVAQQAPVGKGLQTVVDTSYRNTWQLEPDQIRLEHPQWNQGLVQLVRSTATDLGDEPDNVRAELYKVLLYEPGSFFKKHRDTEKADGMFGTLVVQLPSTYTGGAFTVTHGSKTKEIDLGSGGMEWPLFNVIMPRITLTVNTRSSPSKAGTDWLLFTCCVTPEKQKAKFRLQTQCLIIYLA